MKVIFAYRDEPVPLPDLSNSEEYKVEEDIAATAGEILTNTALDPRFSYSKVIHILNLYMSVVLVNV